MDAKTKDTSAELVARLRAKGIDHLSRDSQFSVLEHLAEVKALNGAIQLLDDRITDLLHRTASIMGLGEEEN